MFYNYLLTQYGHDTNLSFYSIKNILKNLHREGKNCMMIFYFFIFFSQKGRISLLALMVFQLLQLLPLTCCMTMGKFVWSPQDPLSSCIASILNKLTTVDGKTVEWNWEMCFWINCIHFCKGLLPNDKNLKI